MITGSEKSQEFIIRHHGIIPQIDMAIEEMSELTKELCKAKREIRKLQAWETDKIYKANREKVVEELADVIVTAVEQIKIIYKIKDEELIQSARGKIIRELSRIKNEE